MNLFRLVLKQMRQRALGTCLTVLSVALGVALATSILILGNESDKLFGQTDYGYDVLVGRAGSPTQLVLNTTYLIDKSPGNIKYAMYEKMLAEWRRDVSVAVPFAVGDSYKNHRIIAVGSAFFGLDDNGKPVSAEKSLEYRPGKHFELASGTWFHPQKLQSVIGSEVADKTGLKLGDTFKPTHGMPAPGETPDVHDVVFTVTGILKPTHTASDRGLYIPLVTFYTIYEHEASLEEIAALQAEGKALPKEEEGEEKPPYHLNPDDTVAIEVPKTDWLISGIMVKSRGVNGMHLMWTINNIGTEAVAVNPAQVMRQFFDTFLGPSKNVLLMVSVLVSIVAGVGILVGIYNSVSARKREIAILRALGATRGRILSIICLEAGAVGVLGCISGLLLGLATAAAGSVAIEKTMGAGITWYNIGNRQLLWYSVGVVALSVLAGLVPALKAYSTPVATNLVAD